MKRIDPQLSADFFGISPPGAVALPAHPAIENFIPNMTQQENAEEIVDAFEMFDNWEDRYRFLIDLGKKLPPLPEGAKNEENRVHGCQSNVWMIAEPKKEDEEIRIDFIADSDSTIVRGLIAILRSVYSGQSPHDILGFDIDGLMGRLGLDQHLSLSRRNGLAGMVSRVKTLAAQLN